MSNLRAWLEEKSPEEREHFLVRIPRLFLQGGQVYKLCSLLSNYDFIEAKINHHHPECGVEALIKDYDLIDDVEFREYYYRILKSFKYGYQTITTLKLIQGALRLSAHILIENKNELVGQLSGRLLHFDNQEVKDFLKQIPQTQTPCLRSLRASLSSPNGRLLSTLNGRESVNAVVVTPDGQQLISGSSDNTVKVLDLNTGAEVSRFTGHSSPVNAVAVTPDGKWGISGASDNIVRVWNLATGAEKRIFDGHSHPVVALAVTPDGKKVVSASIAKKNSIKVWDLETGKEELTLKGHGDIVRTVAITSSNRIISASDNGTIKVWDLRNGKMLSSFTNGREIYGSIQSEAVYTIAVTLDGKWLISGSAHKGTNIIIWNLKTGKKAFTLEGHNNPISALAVTPDGKQVISALFDNTIKIWDIESRKEILTFIGHDGSIYDIAITPDGNKMISASKDKTIKIWNLESIIKTWKLDPKKKYIKLAEKQNAVNDVTITSDSKQAIFALENKIVKILNLEQNNIISSFYSNHNCQDNQENLVIRARKIFEKYILLIHSWVTKILSISFEVSKVIFFPMIIFYLLSIFLFGGNFSTIPTLTYWIIHLQFIIPILKKNYEPIYKQKIKLSTYSKYSDITIKSSRIFENKQIVGVVIAPNDLLICITNRIALPCHFLTVWNYIETKRICDFISIYQYCYIYLILATSVCYISIIIYFLSWNIIWIPFLLILLSLLNKILHSLITFIFYESATAISITPNGKYLISGSTKSTIHVWNLETKKLLFLLKGHRKEITTVTTTPDGKYLISGSKDKTIKIWNLETKKQLFTLKGHSDSINTISVTPDGKYLISGSKDKTIKIWNLETREEIFTFTGHTDSINAINFTSNGQLVISASSDKTIQVWDFTTRKIIAKFTGESAIKCCAVAPDDVTIVAGDISGIVHCLRLEGI